MPNPTPRILELSDQFRAQLLARERTAATAMVRYYGETWRKLRAQITKLEAQIAQMVEAGETISKGRLWRLERLRAIQAQAEQELAKFAQFADPLITANKREAIIAAERNAAALIEAAFPTGAGIGTSFQHMPSDAVEALAGFLADGSPLREVITGYVGDAVEQFSETMVTGLASGWNPRKLARELRSSFGQGLSNMLRLARTEQLRAYRTSTLRTYNESRVVKGWERHADKGPRTCMACILLDGTRHTLAEEMDDHPSGRCGMLPITLTYAELGIDAPEPQFNRETGKDWFLRQDETTQRQMMDSISKQAYDAWQTGEFRLEDIPKLVTDSTWGNSWTTANWGDLVSEGRQAG